jgi:hypothetical protein
MLRLHTSLLIQYISRRLELSARRVKTLARFEAAVFF